MSDRLKNDYIRLRLVALYFQHKQSVRNQEREIIMARLFTYSDAAFEYDDKRTEKLAEYLIARLNGERLSKKTGLNIDRKAA